MRLPGRMMTTLMRAASLRLMIALVITLVSAAATSGQTIAGKLTPEDPLAGGFSSSVAISGNTAIVGAPFTSGAGGRFGAGAAYVFEREQGTANAWRRIAKLIAADPTAWGLFGNSVSISGDTAVIGAYGLTGNANAAYVFARHHGGPNAWGQVAKLTTDDPDVGDPFGISVSISGDTAIIGAGGGSPTRGSAYVFARNQGGTNAWGEVTRFVARDGAPSDAFGLSVSISDAIAIVGAPNLNAAYVFRRDRGGPNVWGEVAKLTASDFSSHNYFGESVSVSGGSAVVGAPGLSLPGAAAYVFTRAGEDDWRPAQKLLPGGLGAHAVENFGYSVALDGDRGVVGAESGSVFVFTRHEDSGTWEQTVTLTPGRPNDRFGTSVSMGGAIVVAGGTTGGGPGGVAYACDLQILNRESCRIAVPIVDELITMSDPVTSCCIGSDFSITATFTNASSIPIPMPFFDVVELTGGNLLANADEGPAAEGATLTPDVGDGVLSPGEPVTVPFVIRLKTFDPFRFFVRIRGEVPSDVP